MTQNINLVPNEPHLKDLLDYFGKQLKLDFNCHHVGTIESFDETDQTAKVTINYVKTFLQIDDIGDQVVRTSSYPVLVSCPVVCLGGGGGALTFPISAGDECLLLFNDRDIDNWFAGSSNSAPATGRLHAFTDAFALVGIRSMPNVLASYSTNSVVLKYHDVKIELFSDKVLITLVSGVTFEYNSSGKLKITNQTTEFVDILNTLFTDIQNGLVTTMLGPEPLQMPTFAADLAKFQSFKG